MPGIGGGVGVYDAGADEASAFIGLNGATCSYPTIVDAITAAASGDTIYISPGVYPERLGLITDDLTFTAANNGCTAEAAGGVTIDANDAAATWGGLAEIASGKSVMFKNLTLTDGTAQFGGILYADASSQVLLDNTDLSLGSASTVGGGLRLILNTTVESHQRQPDYPKHGHRHRRRRRRGHLPGNPFPVRGQPHRRLPTRQHLG